MVHAHLLCLREIRVLPRPLETSVSYCRTYEYLVENCTSHPVSGTIFSSQLRITFERPGGGHGH